MSRIAEAHSSPPCLLHLSGACRIRHGTSTLTRTLSLPAASTHMTILASILEEDEPERNPESYDHDHIQEHSHNAHPQLPGEGHAEDPKQILQILKCEGARGSRIIFLD
ncbi:hypothetical protein BD311DRAFT_765553 [Dichomitus squalens]|uniref:Uncharacterized protein n=1 Tax=Dichomitus squalens TaxID=114155 RepID=A0A4Q9MEU3_9APHY|nr:hypothetical protein BD311DRAFT_765553 [Dichomitus squalens]